MANKLRAIIFSDVKQRDIEFQVYLLRFYNIECEFFAHFKNNRDILEKIKDFDLCIFLFDKLFIGMYYYLGLSDAYGVPKIIFSRDQAANNPILSDNLITYVNFNEKAWFEKLSVDIAINNMIENIKLKKPVEANISKVPSRDNATLSALKERAHRAKSESEVEIILGEVFNHLNILSNRNIVMEGKKLRPDYMIWSSELEYILGNPIIIEIKSSYPSSVDVDKLRLYMQSSKTSFGLILYFEKFNKNHDIYYRNNENIAIGNIIEFIDDAVSLGIKDAVLRCISS